MASEIKITWDGTAPGLSEHRLSVGAFGLPLTLLLAALRRIANQMVTNAVSGDRVQTGRLANAAKNLDIEIVSIKQNSSGVNAVITFREPPPQSELFVDLAERSAIQLLDALDKESKGQPADGSVRQYLRSLPDGTSKQIYELIEGGKPKKKTEIGDVKLTSLPPELPVLRSLVGNVIGVGFEPGKNEVRIKSNDALFSVTAKAEDVEKALVMRREQVRVLAVQEGKPSRLISLRRATDPHFKFDPEKAKNHIFSRWANVLKELAK
jgi:hypothetical protein